MRSRSCNVVLICIVAVVLPACYQTSSNLAGFRYRPDSVKLGKLSGPFDGVVTDAITKTPINSALIYVAWTYSKDDNPLSSNHLNEHLTSTDSRGYYFVPMSALSSDKTITNVHLIVYKRGYVAYRSDRRFSDFKPRFDFAQRANRVLLNPWHDELSHKKHLRYIGEGKLLKTLTAWEIPKPLESNTKDKSSNSSVQISQLLKIHDITSITHYQGSFESGPLGNTPNTTNYSSIHFRAVGKPESFDVALRIWNNTLPVITKQYEEFKQKFMNATETIDQNNRSMTIISKNIYGITYLDETKSTLFLLTCGTSQCKSLKQTQQLRQAIQKRLRTQSL